MEEKELVKLIKQLLTMTPFGFFVTEDRKAVTYKSAHDRYYEICVEGSIAPTVSITISTEPDSGIIYWRYINDPRSTNEIRYAVTDIVESLSKKEMELFQLYLDEAQYKGMDSLLTDNGE